MKTIIKLYPGFSAMVLLLLAGSSAFCQDANSLKIKPDWYLGVSVAGTFQSVERQVVSPFMVMEEHNFAISPAIWFAFSHKPKHFHRVEIGNFDLNRRKQTITDTVSIAAGARAFNWRTKFRYEFDYVFLTKKPFPLKPFVGFGASLDLAYYRNVPLVSTVFRSNHFSQVLSPEITPGVRWNIIPRIRMDLSIPLPLSFMRITHARMQNPGIPVDQQTTLSFDNELNFVNSIRVPVRIGFAIKL